MNRIEVGIALSQPGEGSSVGRLVKWNVFQDFDTPQQRELGRGVE